MPRDVFLEIVKSQTVEMAVEMRVVTSLDVEVKKESEHKGKKIFLVKIVKTVHKKLKGGKIRRCV